MTPLEGLRVLDFSHALAGPYCSLVLTHYGADVFKIESPEGGDIGRGWGPPFTGEQATYFLGINAGKRGVSINLKHPEGRELCLRMIEHADVLLENLGPGTMDRLGLGYAAARDHNPRIVYASISGYGQDGPWRDEPAMDLILQASSGLLSVTGTEDGQTARCGHSVADITAGMFALIGILMALQARERNGVGQFVDVSMFDSMISAMASNYMNYLGTGVVPRPRGTAFASIVPYRTFPTADRDVAIAVGSEKLWAAFCRAIAHPELETHPDYATNDVRVKNRAVLEPMLARIFREGAADEWKQRLGALGVPCTTVLTMEEVVSSPQAAARQMFPTIDHSGSGPFPVTGLPLKFDGTPGRIRHGAPLLGEHTREALGELLSLNGTELSRLESDGVIYSAKP